MTALSVNLNKLALLRNSRGRNYPDLLKFAERFISLGVKGITVHPRPDERHITRQDAYALAGFLAAYPEVEYNIEGNPTPAFMELIRDTRPTQCTLVPDADNQLTSDHGWDCVQQAAVLGPLIREIKALGIRCAVFLDPDPEQAKAAAALGADRIELYTQAYAEAFHTPEKASMLKRYADTAACARECGLGLNAGHDLDLENLADFLQIPGIEEVSIGHALMVECIEQGLPQVVSQYLAICKQSA